MTEELIKRILPKVRNKRALFVIKYILKHGSVTTEDIQKAGYDHPPRAAKDVRDMGIPLLTKSTKSSSGRTIARYVFGDLSKVKADRLNGRKIIPKKFKDMLYRIQDKKCKICYEVFDKRYLQMDHRIPYEIAGDIYSESRSTSDYMLLCSSCNRAKSWSCEHCNNYKIKDIEVCSSCYWKNPEHYEHLAMRQIRRIEIVWNDKEIHEYEKLKEEALKSDETIQEYIKYILARREDPATRGTA